MHLSNRRLDQEKHPSTSPLQEVVDTRKEIFESVSKISPNFTNEISKLAEQRIRKIVKMAKNLGVEFFSLEQGRREILETVKRNLPQRYELVLQKLTDEGIDLEDLSKELLLDRMLGIDILFKFQDKIYAADVTTGKHTVVKNKQKKIEEMRSVYQQLGIDQAIVIRLKEDITEDIILDIFTKLEEVESLSGVFSMVMRYPETKVKKGKKQKQRSLAREVA